MNERSSRLPVAWIGYLSTASARVPIDPLDASLALVREAARLQAKRARQAGAAAARRGRLLRLCFLGRLSIRQIADRWQMEVAQLHAEYWRARQEFRTARVEVMFPLSGRSRRD